MMTLSSPAEFWQHGGAVILVILAASLIALTVFMARMWTIRRDRVVPRRLAIQVRDLVVREEVAEAMTLCRMDDSSLARVYLTGLRQLGKPRDVIKEFLGEVGRHEGMMMHRGLATLETVAAVAPLLGLLGTVWGMIDVFQAIVEHGVGDAAALAGGIGTALYTTLAGLLVAIPVRVGHSALATRVERLILDLEQEALEVLDLLVTSGGSDPDETRLKSPEATGPRAVG